jgi:hypothetical protein
MTLKAVSQYSVWLPWLGGQPHMASLLGGVPLVTVDDRNRQVMMAGHKSHPWPTGHADDDQ